MLRKRSVGNKKSTFPAQALPWSGSTGIISASPPALVEGSFDITQVLSTPGI